jgi:hypothetical protein
MKLKNNRGDAVRYIHVGRGAVLSVNDAPDYVDVTEVKPAQPQRFRVRLKSKNRHLASAKSHTNYRSGFIYEMGDDQCRYIIVDENRLCCGAVIQGGRTIGTQKPYCDAHCKLV